VRNRLTEAGEVGGRSSIWKCNVVKGRLANGKKHARRLRQLFLVCYQLAFPVPPVNGRRPIIQV
jgi:hypothetical protein